MSDQYARTLLPPDAREQIYSQLNPCNYAVQDNCPSAARALYLYMYGGIQPDRIYPGAISSNTSAPITKVGDPVVFRNSLARQSRAGLK